MTDHNDTTGRLAALPQGARVVVAMSGGVDSSVVAALLHDRGYDVIGITLQLYDHGAAVQKRGACCAGQDIHDAQRVAQTLGIPHYVLDYESRFRDQVIEEFADSYAAGETPVPCISCNQTVKFTDLLSTARELGAQALATGHYIASRPDATGHFGLYRAEDAERDQSYFLYATTQEQLDYLRFPLGDLAKSDVRELARRYELSVAEKSDSQDICFVPTGRYTSIVERLRPDAMRSGDIVHTDGRVLGTHDGIYRYTIGQRRGLGIASGDPLYVVRLDAASASVIVGPRSALEADRISLREVNWIGSQSQTMAEAAAANRPCAVRVRSTQAPMAARLTHGDDGAPVVLLDQADIGVSPGQACVIYDSAAPRAQVLGGGVIDCAVRSSHAPGAAVDGSPEERVA